jgi:hypothetical protein
MAKHNALEEFKGLLTAWLRHFETNRAADDQKRQEIATIDDDRLLKKWLWIVCLVGAPAVFIVSPLLLGFLQSILPAAIVGFLWFAVKVMMASVLILFVLAALFTIKKSN